MGGASDFCVVWGFGWLGFGVGGFLVRVFGGVGIG